MVLEINNFKNKVGSVVFPDGIKNVWIYKTVDDLVNSPGYFDDVSHLLTVGDTIECQLGSAPDKKEGKYLVSEISTAGVVTVKQTYIGT